MLVILSPAKTMDMSVVEQEFPGSTPKYTAEAEYLAEKMRHFSASELEKMLKSVLSWLRRITNVIRGLVHFRILANRLCLLITGVYSKLLIRILFL